MYNNSKILTIPQAATLANRLRKRKQKIATTNGCFDILHRGHFALLKRARKEGGVTIVGLNSDKSVRLLKGNKRPIRPQKDRAELLAELPWVDYVVPFDQKDSAAFVSAIKPDVHVNDSAYGKNCIEAPIVKAYGGKIAVVKLVRCMSTTDVINVILKKHC